MADYNLTKMALNMFCPGNEVKLDDAGLPSVMVWIPAFKNSDVLTGGDDNIHPAFIVNGKQIPGFYFSKYENVVHDGKAYSLPAEAPQRSISFDASRESCENKGYGWHLSTAAEWAAIALWCKKNGHLPYGNTYYGKDNRENSYKAIPVSTLDDGKTGVVATGTGPLAWSHDGTVSGIWDMGGNLSEWQGGIRLVWGELQILANNDAADPDNPQNQTSVCWKAINAADGSLVDPENSVSDTAVKESGATVKLDNISDNWTFSTNITSATNASRSCLFGNVTCDGTIGAATKVLLRALALLPDEGASVSDYEDDYMYWNNTAAECNVQRGGTYAYGKLGGIFCINGSNKGAYTSSQLGLRASYIPYM